MLTLKAIASATQFFKNSCKISHPPQLQASRDALLNFAASHKSGLILVFKEVVLKLKLAKNHFNKNCAPKFLFFNGKAFQDAYNQGGWLIL